VFPEFAGRGAVTLSCGVCLLPLALQVRLPVFFVCLNLPFQVQDLCPFSDLFNLLKHSSILFYLCENPFELGILEPLFLRN
jgi:hypothetical protein